jgi:molybdate transport system regulatory protein
MARLTIRIDLSPTSAVGPGKIRLLEHIDATGSIAAAGRAMDMSYRRAWLLVDELNRTFKAPVATTEHGGRAGGGASLTEFGRRLVRQYRDMEATAHSVLAKPLATMGGAVRQAGGRRRTVRRRAAR